jgi:hypothetical protein
MVSIRRACLGIAATSIRATRTSFQKGQVSGSAKCGLGDIRPPRVRAAASCPCDYSRRRSKIAFTRTRLTCSL